MPAAPPTPPYWVVIFTSEHSDDLDGYAATAARMVELAQRQPGFLGLESVRDGRRGVTLSYWRDLESIRAWRDHPEHREARRQGRERWYREWSLRVARVEREERPPGPAERLR